MGEWVSGFDVEKFWYAHSWPGNEPLKTLDRLHGCLDIEAAKELAALMSEISENQYCAGWEAGLEFSLFAFAYEGAEYGDGPSLKQRQGLIELARRCGGWWVWDNNLRFIRMEEWTEMYKSG